MSRSVCFLGIFLILVTGSVNAQNNQDIGSSITPEQRRHALVIDIDTRVLNDNQKIIWNEVQRKIGIPGVPVSIRLVGTNIIVDVQFISTIHPNGNVLVAHVQIWINSQGDTITYHTSVQAIPVTFNEPFYFYPLGTSNPSIELLMTIYPYNEIFDTVSSLTQ